MTSAPTSTWRVGKLAHRVGKTVRTIHFYEELGLLMPTGRTKGGFRIYDESAVNRIHWIERLQEIGFSLTEIRDFLIQYKGHTHGPAASADLRTFYSGKIVETRASISRLQSLETELEQSLAYLAVCSGCEMDTPLAACNTCSTEQHQGMEPPPMVAAVTR